MTEEWRNVCRFCKSYSIKRDFCKDRKEKHPFYFNCIRHAVKNRKSYLWKAIGYLEKVAKRLKGEQL